MQNKGLSDSHMELMRLQGVNWVLRKAITMADIPIHITQQGEGVDTVLVLEYIASFGLRGTTETRKLDWNQTTHKDFIFGEVKGRSKFVSADEVSRDSSLKSLFEEFGMEVQDIVYSEADAADGTWTSQMVSFLSINLLNFADYQLWGFEVLNGSRFFVRNARVCKSSAKARAQLVYNYIS